MKRSIPGFTIISPGITGNRWQACETTSEQVFHPVYVHAEGDKTAYVLGSPIWQNSVDRHRIASMFVSYAEENGFLKEINGTFLLVLVDSTSKKICAVTDRFGSWPFFYISENRSFGGGTNYLSLLKLFQKYARIVFQPQAVYEFIYMQRLLGTKSFDSKVKAMPGGAVLSWRAEGGDLTVRRYWQPDYTKTTAPVKENIRALSDLLRSSCEKYLADGVRYGLLLSGGLDSRAVLAALPPQVICYTIGEHYTNECRIAALLAEKRQSEHFFVKRAPSHYADILPDAVRLGSGMYVYDHAHFLGLKEAFGQQSEVLLHGHGLDYFFQGMYLPAKRVKIAGRPTYVKRLLPVKADVAHHYYERAPYRLKHPGVLSLLKKEKRSDFTGYIIESIRRLVEEASDFTADRYDIWEYIHNSNLSRHYTHLNIESLRFYIEERCPAFENELYDFYLSLPVEHRFGARLFKRSIAHMVPPLMRVPNANTNMRADRSPAAATAEFYINVLCRKIHIPCAFPGPPSQSEKSWHDRNAVLRNIPVLRTAAGKLGRSERLAALGCFDMDFIKKIAEDHLHKTADAGDLLVTLLTVDGFLMAWENLIE